jgi:hypothetical protein
VLENISLIRGICKRQEFGKNIITVLVEETPIRHAKVALHPYLLHVLAGIIRRGPAENLAEGRVG